MACGTGERIPPTQSETWSQCLSNATVVHLKSEFSSSGSEMMKPPLPDLITTTMTLVCQCSFSEIFLCNGANHVRDIVNHTRSNGNVWEMLLGSIDQDFDWRPGNYLAPSLRRGRIMHHRIPGRCTDASCCSWLGHLRFICVLMPFSYLSCAWTGSVFLFSLGVRLGV